MGSKVFLVWLHSLGFSQNLLRRIFEYEENYEEIYYGFNREFLAKNRMSHEKINYVLSMRDSLNLKEIEEYLEDEKVDIVTLHSDAYPEDLYKIKNPPFLLYIKGILWNEPKLWFVWSRKVSTYWKKAISHLIPDLAHHFTIVSGGAIWVDTLSHKESLRCRGKTVVCVGTGIDKVYPVWNKAMYEEIINAWGTIVSIFPIWTRWDRHTFPIRNEIIVALSKWVVVVEAQEKSWSLISARLCLEHGRDLFAVPWELMKSQSEGTNELIKSWKAKMVLDSSDILGVYGLATSKKGKVEAPKFDNEIDENIFDLLLVEDLISDDIATRLKKPISEVSLRLSMLELMWIVGKNLWWKYEIK